MYICSFIGILLLFIFSDRILSFTPIERYISFFTGEYVELERKGLISMAIDLIKNNPLGIGIGKFAIYSPAYLYPHNLILEAFVEFGWIFGGYLVCIILISLVALLFFRSNKTLEEQAFLGFFIMALTNSMFSGNMVSPKELYISLPIALTIFIVGIRKNKLNKTKRKF